MMTSTPSSDAQTEARHQDRAEQRLVERDEQDEADVDQCHRGVSSSARRQRAAADAKVRCPVHVTQWPRHIISWGPVL